MSETEHMILPRRMVMAAGVGFALASTSFAGAAVRPAKAPSDRERANVALMRAFWADWGAADLDIDAVVRKYMADDASVRWIDDAPVYKGVAAAAKAAKDSMPRGSRAVITVHEVFAHGPMVAASRTDIIKVPGQPDASFDTAGVAFVLNNRIVEYSDYVVRS